MSNLVLLRGMGWQWSLSIFMVCVLAIGFYLISSPAHATSPEGKTERVSISSAGEQGNASSGGSVGLSISADGRYVVFISDASNLVEGDTNRMSDVFVYDLKTGKIERVSVSSSGEQANSFSLEASISSDGRYVAFWSAASNLVEDDTNGKGDIFVHDRETKKTERVNISCSGDQANGFCGYARISADGRYVVFISSANNLVQGDTNGYSDVFVHDRETGKTERVSISSNGEQANNTSFDPSISSDGRYIAFSSAASNLVPGDINGFPDVFVHDRVTGATECLTINGNGRSDKTSISADGRYVAFASAARNLVSGDTNGYTDIFVHDRETGKTERVSVSSKGAQANNYSTEVAISADARYVAFSSAAGNLVENDSNAKVDIFVHDREAGITERVSVSSGGEQANNASLYTAISADGRYVTFSSSASNLVPGDTNNTWDVFIRDRSNDTTPPTTIDDLSGISGENGWFTSDVQVTLTATDNEGGSGVAGTEFSFDGQSWNTYGDPITVSDEGTTTIYYRSVDNAGNVEAIRERTIKMDKTQPLILIFSPLDGAEYSLNQKVTADWLVVDFISGIASETGTVPPGMPIDTSTFGKKSFTVEAVDNAGNRSEMTVTYYVKYNFSGILKPICADGSSTFKLGSTVPVKFRLYDGEGGFVDNAVARIYMAKVEEGDPASEMEAESGIRPIEDNLFRYDCEDDQYVFNLKTRGLPAGVWQVRVELDDGTSKHVNISLR